MNNKPTNFGDIFKPKIEGREEEAIKDLLSKTPCDFMLEIRQYIWGERRRDVAFGKAVLSDKRITDRYKEHIQELIDFLKDVSLRIQTSPELSSLADKIMDQQVSFHGYSPMVEFIVELRKELNSDYSKKNYGTFSLLAYNANTNPFYWLITTLMDANKNVNNVSSITKLRRLLTALLNDDYSSIEELK